MQKYTYRDQVFTFEGCISVEEQDAWAMPWRIDFRQRGYYPGLEGEATEPIGVRLGFRTSSIGLIVFLAEPHPGLKLALFVDGLFIQNVLVNSDGQVVFDPLPFGTKVIDIWLDHRHPCTPGGKRPGAGTCKRVLLAKALSQPVCGRAWQRTGGRHDGRSGGDGGNVAAKPKWRDPSAAGAAG